jgi:hypothetical protein
MLLSVRLCKFQPVLLLPKPNPAAIKDYNSLAGGSITEVTVFDNNSAKRVMHRRAANERLTLWLLAGDCRN